MMLLTPALFCHKETPKLSLQGICVVRVRKGSIIDLPQAFKTQRNLVPNLGPQLGSRMDLSADNTHCLSVFSSFFSFYFSVEEFFSSILAVFLLCDEQCLWYKDKNTKPLSRPLIVLCLCLFSSVLFCSHKTKIICNSSLTRAFILSDFTGPS